MDKKLYTKICERCGEKVQVPEEYFENENIFKLCQVQCPNSCKIHTFDSYVVVLSRYIPVLYICTYQVPLKSISSAPYLVRT